MDFSRLKRAVFIFVSIAVCLCTNDAEAIKISVTAPSLREQVFESGRDFYVIGTLDREGISADKLPIDIKVEVVETGLAREGIIKPLRTVRSNVDKVSGITPERDIYFRYEGKAPWVNIPREHLVKSPPPDIIYRHGDPDSFNDPRLKAAVTENTFAALIQGGCTKDFDTDYSKIYSGDLEWKVYRIIVSALSGDTVLDSSYLDVVFGSSKDKVLTRFSPKEHFDSVKNFADERGYRIYIESFPGYWNLGLMGQTYEIPLRWRANDSLEYTAGHVHAIIYNITEERSTCQTVEIGKIAFDGWLDSDEITYYFYDIGEPFLNYTDYDGTRKLSGSIVPFEKDDRLHFTRAEFNAPSDYAPFETAGRIDKNIYDSVTVEDGETLTLYGAVTPIQPLLSEVTENGDGTFKTGNRIAYINYTFEDMICGIIYRDKRDVTMRRIYNTNGERKSSDSIYEFRHTFDLPPSMKGRIVTVRAAGYDRHGEEVYGTEEFFYLRVK